MRMGVDEAGKDRDVPEIDGLCGLRRDEVEVCPRAVTHHAAATGQHPSSADGRRGDRENPGGAIEDQWPVSRAFFSAALRAA